MLLCLELHGFQIGNMILARSILQLFHPALVNRILLSGLNVLLHRTLKRFQITGLQKLLRCIITDVVVISQALVPLHAVHLQVVDCLPVLFLYILLTLKRTLV